MKVTAVAVKKYAGATALRSLSFNIRVNISVWEQRTQLAVQVQVTVNVTAQKFLVSLKCSFFWKQSTFVCI